MQNKQPYLYGMVFILIYFNLWPTVHDDILLIVNYNHAFYDSVDFLRKIYSPYFPNIVFCGPEPGLNVEHIDHYKGFFGYKGICHAMKKYQNFAGYLFVNDDSIINCWNFDRFDKNKIWFFRQTVTPLNADLIKNKWAWWNTKWGYRAMVQAYSHLPENFLVKLHQNLGQQMVARGFSDVIYFPAIFKEEVEYLINYYADYNLFIEIALPMICGSLAPIEEREVLKGLCLWTWDREKVLDYYNPELDFIHPIKLSHQKNRDFIEKAFTSIF